jgi:hypothetical protein
MRGAERPGRIKWTRPFLKPLQPLDDEAALNTFLDIADDDYERAIVRELLDLTGNLPLAVTLIANVVAFEGPDATLSRWRTERTRVLSDGYDKKSSLDISIMLSFTSTRMTVEAQELLSVLALLPDGFSDTELVQSNLGIPNILAAKATLIRTSLAYIGMSSRLLALVPIREHVAAAHPPSAALKYNLRQYFGKLLNLWKQFKLMPSADVVKQLSSNLGNMCTVLADGLQDDAPDIVSTLANLLVLSGFSRMKTNDSSSLTSMAEKHILRFPDNAVYGSYFLDKFFASRYHPIRDPEAQIALGNRYFETAKDQDKGDVLSMCHC